MHGQLQSSKNIKVVCIEFRLHSECLVQAAGCAKRVQCTVHV